MNPLREPPGGGASDSFSNLAAVLGKPLTEGDPANQSCVSVCAPLGERPPWQFGLRAGGEDCPSL